MRWRAAHGVWNQALSLAHTTSHRGRMEAPKPRAGPFIATTMGFLKWMKANTKSLQGSQSDQYRLSHLMVSNKSVIVYSGQRCHYRTASAMRLLSFLRSVDRRPIRYDGSRPLQKTVPTELSNNNLLSSAAALPRARHTSFMIWRGKRENVCDFLY